MVRARLVPLVLSHVGGFEPLCEKLLVRRLGRRRLARPHAPRRRSQCAGLGLGRGLAAVVPAAPHAAAHAAQAEHAEEADGECDYSRRQRTPQVLEREPCVRAGSRAEELAALDFRDQLVLAQALLRDLIGKPLALGTRSHELKLKLLLLGARHRAPGHHLQLDGFAKGLEALQLQPLLRLRLEVGHGAARTDLEQRPDLQDFLPKNHEVVKNQRGAREGGLS